ATTDSPATLTGVI
nr:RecName: Full=Ferritin-2, chloroplastic [Pisum sativum]